MIAIGNGEKCPFCDTILDERVRGSEIMQHLLKYHRKEILRSFENECKR